MTDDRQNPIELTNAATPWWMKEIKTFDGLEIHPVRDHNWDDDAMGVHPFHIPDGHETCCEPCQPGEEHFWSVYGHLTEGGILCIEDFPTETEARAFAAQLLTTYPHLRKLGLWG